MPRIELYPLARMEVELSEPINVGAGPKGARMIINVPSIRLTGERIHAELATDDAADWATFSEDGKVAALDVRATLKTHDGAFVYVEYTGRLDVEAGLVAAAPTFETGAEEYAWLNSIQAVSAGEVDMASGQLIYQIYEARPLAGD